jgi:hypothetical protein
MDTCEGQLLTRLCCCGLVHGLVAGNGTLVTISYDSEEFGDVFEWAHSGPEVVPDSIITVPQGTFSLNHDFAENASHACWYATLTGHAQ